MSMPRLLTKIMMITIPAMALVGCGSHGVNYSDDYHINTMQRVDKNAGSMDKERKMRMQRDKDYDKGPRPK